MWEYEPTNNKETNGLSTSQQVVAITALVRRCAGVLPAIHWKGNVFILMKLSSLAALEVVKMTTSSAASDENFVKTTFSFQWRAIDLVPRRQCSVCQPNWDYIMIMSMFGTHTKMHRGVFVKMSFIFIGTNCLSMKLVYSRYVLSHLNINITSITLWWFL